MITGNIFRSYWTNYYITLIYLLNYLFYEEILLKTRSDEKGYFDFILPAHEVSESIDFKISKKLIQFQKSLWVFHLVTLTGYSVHKKNSFELIFVILHQ